MTPRAFLAASGLLAACGSGGRSAQDRPVDSAATAVNPVPDSLALRLSGGGEIWFTDSRTATDSLGQGCRERALEIRRDGRRIPIPLLYTAEPPVQINTSTIRARLWLRCRPIDRYDVDLDTGRPTRVR